jgi:hypothetical protein
MFPGIVSYVRETIQTPPLKFKPLVRKLIDGRPDGETGRRTGLKKRRLVLPFGGQFFCLKHLV